MAITEYELYKLLDRVLFLNIAATLILTIGTALLGVQYARTGEVSVLAELIIVCETKHERKSGPLRETSQSIALTPLLCLALLLTHRVKPDSTPMAMIAPEFISTLSAIAR
jgi:hypothetical protein